MDFDSEDVNVATITFKYNSGGTHELTDGSVTITFGGDVRKSDIAQAWVDDPNRTYPDPVGGHTSWPTAYQFAINSIYTYNLGYSGVDPLPYDSFFSYATKVNGDTFSRDGYVEIHDYHAGQEELEQYIATLTAKDYIPATGTSGMTYRSESTLREKGDYKLYSDITLKLEDGLVISATTYYTYLTFSGRDAINSHIHSASENDKFVELPDDANITSWSAADYTFRQYESMADLFDYNLYTHVIIEYQDANAFKTYLDQVFASYVANGFVRQKYSDTYINKDYVSKSMVELISNHNGVADILFSNMKYVDPSEAATNVSDAGFPSISDELSKITSVLEMKYYAKAIMGIEFEHYYSIGMQFSSNSELRAFVDDYIAALLDAGFKQTTEELRTCRYIKGDTRTVVMDYQYKSGTYFNAWFMIV